MKTEIIRAAECHTCKMKKEKFLGSTERSEELFFYSGVFSEQSIFFCLRSADFNSIFVIQREIPKDTPIPTAKSMSPMAEVVKVTSILSSVNADHVFFNFSEKDDSVILLDFLLLFSIDKYQAFQS